MTQIVGCFILDEMLWRPCVVTLSMYFTVCTCVCVSVSLCVVCECSNVVWRDINLGYFIPFTLNSQVCECVGDILRVVWGFP